ncbi:hypothetical protein GALMADRAFT_237385 [Galerina marginata CBS 339.88]|uniref:Uncharacterized protein n=1 Tax=Galerina marginata (strain CBS 339.88) TaxID=685588 RepID=A0A067TMS2_GALM3|nr:hypothetical protein GALMADRAFT_237385 [Galerina marginata CBS 339.88]
MGFSLQNILCFCCRNKDEIDDPYNESSHLIPQTVEPPVIYSNVVLVDHKKLQERLGHIVRAKEGKMVNVASHIPFNLHNQVIPQEHHSISRSASGSVDAFDGQHRHPRALYPDFYSNQDTNRHQQHNPQAISSYPFGDPPRSRSPSPSSGLPAGPSTGTRSWAQISEQPKATPILNVRLVGYTDTMSRGRTRARGLAPSGLSSPPHGESQAEDDESATTPVVTSPGESTPNQHTALARTYNFKLTDTKPITVSWGD